MSELIFADRDDAGRALAEQVVRHLRENPAEGRPVVLALPRGGVPVAAPVAELIGADLDIVVVRKIGAPDQPEFGVGAVAEDGPPVFDESALRFLGITEADLAGTVARERAELARRIRRYRGDRPAPDVANRTVVVVDDGLATGITAHAALRGLWRQRPARLVLAVPVCSRQAHDTLAGDADDLICLRTPEPFIAVGHWYADFSQLTDDDVARVLAAARPGRDAGVGYSKSE
jgi:predicted phosphoribosyltransferase